MGVARTALAAAIVVLTTQTSFALETAPAGAILTIERPGTPTREMTMADIEKMPRREFVTRTPWHDAKTRFEGVPLTAFLAEIGARRGVVTVSALNGYIVDIPVDDPRNKQALLSYKRDGAYMRIRDKGPLFIVFDFDSDPALYADQYSARSIWGVRSIKME